MSSFFDRALEYVLKNEGGFVNDPNDPGGATNYGITQGTYASWRGEPVNALDVETMSLEEAGTIYRERYWTPLGCDKLRQYPIACAMFDAGVLFGIHASATSAQQASMFMLPEGLVVDGKIGVKSIAALDLVQPQVFLPGFRHMLRQRVNRIIELRPTSERYRDGWNARIDRYPDLASE